MEAVTFSVVEFPNEQSITALPSCWISPNKTSAQWPAIENYTTMRKTLKGDHVHTGTWKSVPVRVISRRLYSNFNVADKKAEAAEQTSNVDTTSSEELEINDEEDQRHSIPKFPNSRKDAHFTKTAKLSAGPTKKVVRSLEAQEINRKPKKTKLSTERSAAPISENIDAPFTKTAKFSAEPPKKVACSHVEEQEINHEPKGTRLNTERNSEPISEYIGFQNTVLKLLEQVIYEQKKIRSEIASLKELKNIDKTVAIPSKVLFNCPADNEEELLCLEAQARDPEIAAQMITEISRVGGKTYKDITYNAMSRIITSRLAQNYSLHGKKGKSPFKNLKLSAIVIQGIMKSPGSTNASMTDIELRIGTFLAQSKDRNGGRKERDDRRKRQESCVTVQNRTENKDATDELQIVSAAIELV